MENYFDQPDTLTTKSILALFETDKAQRKSFVDDINARLDEGEVNPLVALLQVKCLEDIVIQFTSTDKEKNKNVEAAIKFKKHVAEAFTNHAAGQKSFGFHNATFRTMEAGTKYDYSTCGDSLWDDLDTRIASLIEAKKQRENFLKTVPSSGLIITDSDTGETTTIYPPSKSSTTTIAVSLK